ncbi:carbonic anhydrase 2-like [Musca domestica]|uniref:Carbonic anhydrase 2-like n=1 Tax=Musca domestica TaxID=7370 RepID=A0ABM3V7G1_MUSDO|nr:carbonic anhydrase 2-like [Musca domestica]
MGYVSQSNIIQGPALPSPKAKECIGKHQIPLNERSVDIRVVQFEPFAFDNFDAKPLTAEIVNSEDLLQIQLRYSEDERPVIYGGPLQELGNFTLARIDWYSLEVTDPANDLDDIKFPVELHIIFYNKKYRSLAKAGHRPNGNMVLAFPLKVQSRIIFDGSNNNLEPMF